MIPVEYPDGYSNEDERRGHLVWVVVWINAQGANVLLLRGTERYELEVLWKWSLGPGK